MKNDELSIIVAVIGIFIAMGTIAFMLF